MFHPDMTKKAKFEVLVRELSTKSQCEQVFEELKKVDADLWMLNRVAKRYAEVKAA